MVDFNFRVMLILAAWNVPGTIRGLPWQVIEGGDGDLGGRSCVRSLGRCIRRERRDGVPRCEFVVSMGLGEGGEWVREGILRKVERTP